MGSVSEKTLGDGPEHEFEAPTPPESDDIEKPHEEVNEQADEEATEQADEEANEDDDNAQDESRREDNADSHDPEDPLLNQELIRLVRTTAGADLYVHSIAQNALARANWGSLLGAAPDALGRLGQCFVLASDPLASSLVFPESAGLQHKSLRANLVQASHLGREAFRDAEARMKKISMVIQAVCEPGGTIDMIIEAVEDEDLAELDLPDQLATLKEISEGCIQDTKSVKDKVDNWAGFARKIHRACVDQDDDLGKNQTDMGRQVEIKEITVQMKHSKVEDTKAQTAEYRKQLEARQKEYSTAESSQRNGHWTDLAVDVGNAVIDGAKHYLSPWSLLSGIRSGMDQSSNGHDTSSEPPDALAKEDSGYEFAQMLQDVLLRFHRLLTYEDTDGQYGGVDWESLCGRNETQSYIRFVQDQFKDLANRFHDANSPVARQVRTIVEPAEEVAAAIWNLVQNEGNVAQQTGQLVAGSVNEWRKQVKRSQVGVSNILAQGYESLKKAQAESKKHKGRNRDRGMSRAQMRFERFRMAQKALFESEERLVKRLDDEMKATEEFNTMELELKSLLSQKATMAQVKDIVSDTVKHLHYFCERLDELASFFTQLQNYVEDMNKTRVEPFRQNAVVAKTMGNRAKEQTVESVRQRQAKIAQKKLEQLRMRALELKGYYIVAQAMSDTYTEVSTKYIIPGVNRIDELSLPDAKNLSKEERAKKVSEVGDMARQAKDDVKRLANARKQQLIKAMTENRGEIEEIKAVEDGKKAEGNMQ